ncbi:unnamed protein product [Nezara viridula]|uniref:Uncharacterized protein n=1 Tax=Nezara viridula TaxID=85310 RepID=A0A9P0MPF4_NEZVI|nr:unnamed protein product [Nezara viridula]
MPMAPLRTGIKPSVRWQGHYSIEDSTSKPADKKEFPQTAEEMKGSSLEWMSSHFPLDAPQLYREHVARQLHFMRGCVSIGDKRIRGGFPLPGSGNWPRYCNSCGHVPPPPLSSPINSPLKCSSFQFIPLPALSTAAVLRRLKGGGTLEADQDFISCLRGV